MKYLASEHLALLSIMQLQAIDDLEHECDLISVTPRPSEVRWVLERVGAPAEVCDAVWIAT